MPGAWELQQQPQESVLVCILTRELVTTAWAFGFKHLQIPGSWTVLSGMPFDHARNVGCQKTLENNFTYCFFLDDDTIPPADAIPRLMAHKKPIVSGLYYRRNLPIVPVMLKDVAGGGRQWITEYKVPDLMEVDYVGSGCMLIHNSLLRSMPPISEYRRWFDWRVDRIDMPERERMSEDFTFCKWLREKMGVKILVDTSVQCKHIGLSESRINGLTPEFRPLELMA